VRVADDLRKATVFLGYAETDPDGEPDIDARATGFFVAWVTDATFPRTEEREQGAIYLVTAKHCAKQLGSHFVIRYNKLNETPAPGARASGIERVDNPDWVYHPDPTVDVAVMHWGFPRWADVVPISGRTFIRPGIYWPEDRGEKIPEVFPDRELGIGDITYVVGLFNPIRKARINLPVVYTGHIALLPEDYKIDVYDPEGENQVECYLVQAPGMGGLSGAPVFARRSYSVYGNYRPEEKIPPRGRGITVPGRMHGLTGLLGLWSASWADPPDDTLAKYHPTSAGRKVPVGFGIVVPSHKIVETLNHPELIKVRRDEYARRTRENAATLDDGL
jgi:hypothetical protein